MAFDLNQIPKNVWDRQFKTAAEMPLTWKSKAGSLKLAADILYQTYTAASTKILQADVEEVENARLSGEGDAARELSEEEERLYQDTELLSISMMLIGYALENLAKSVLILREQNYLNKKGKFKFKSHNLLELVRDKCRVTVNDRDEVVLRLLTDYIQWRGRYPIPVESKLLYPHSSAGQANSVQPHQIFHKGDYEISVALFEGLFQLLENERMSRAASDAPQVDSPINTQE